MMVFGKNGSRKKWGGVGKTRKKPGGDLQQGWGGQGSVWTRLFQCNSTVLWAEGKPRGGENWKDWVLLTQMGTTPSKEKVWRRVEKWGNQQMFAKGQWGGGPFVHC